LLQADAPGICEAQRFDGMINAGRIATSKRRATMKFPVRSATLFTATQLMAAALISTAICSGTAVADGRAGASVQYDAAMKNAPMKFAMGPVSAPQKPGGTGGAVESTGCDGSCPIRHKTIKQRRH
jgi:hypothetical protein